jgi:hypothetical protein
MATVTDSNPTDTAGTTIAVAVNGVSTGNDTGKHDDDNNMLLLHIHVESDYRSVTPVNLLQLQKPFEGELMF